jgi:hypothetical protein
MYLQDEDNSEALSETSSVARFSTTTIYSPSGSACSFASAPLSKSSGSSPGFEATIQTEITELRTVFNSTLTQFEDRIVVLEVVMNNLFTVFNNQLTRIATSCVTPIPRKGR